MIDRCINCQVPTTITDDQDFAWCPACYGAALAEGQSLIRDFELYLECWAAYRDWELKHPVVARVLNYTEMDR